MQSDKGRDDQERNDDKSAIKVDPQQVWDGFSPKSFVDRRIRSASTYSHGLVFFLIVFACALLGGSRGSGAGIIGGAVFGFVIGVIYYGISLTLGEMNKNLKRIADSLKRNNPK